MELTIALVMFLILFAGAVKIFAWLNGRMVRQQVEYEETRVDAAVWDRQAVATGSLSGVTESALPLAGEDIVDDSAYPQLNIFE
jgi:hypothetical protein